jgi:hypothetical protein
MPVDSRAVSPVADTHPMRASGYPENREEIATSTIRERRLDDGSATVPGALVLDAQAARPRVLSLVPLQPVARPLGRGALISPTRARLDEDTRA